MSVWTVLSVDRVVDGDTVRVTRQRVVGVVDGLTITATDVEPVAVRLIHIDTPERGESGWGLAKEHLEAWVTEHEWPEFALALDEAGRDNFGRLLGDLRAPDGDTATVHMVRDKGWPVWGGKA